MSSRSSAGERGKIAAAPGNVPDPDELALLQAFNLDALPPPGNVTGPSSAECDDDCVDFVNSRHALKDGAAVDPEMELARLHFEEAQLRAKEEEQVLLRRRLEEKVERMRAEVDAATRERETLQSQVDALEEERASMLPRLDSLIERRDEIRSEHDRLASDRDDAKVLAERTSNEMEQRRSYEAEMSAAMEDLKAEAKRVASAKVHAQRRFDAVARERDELLTRAEPCLRERNEALREKEKLEKEREELRLMVQRLREQQEGMNRKLEHITEGAAAAASARGSTVSGLGRVLSSFRRREGRTVLGGPFGRGEEVANGGGLHVGRMIRFDPPTSEGDGVNDDDLASMSTLSMSSRPSLFSSVFRMRTASSKRNCSSPPPGNECRERHEPSCARHEAISAEESSAALASARGSNESGTDKPEDTVVSDDDSLEALSDDDIVEYWSVGRQREE